MSSLRTTIQFYSTLGLNGDKMLHKHIVDIMAPVHNDLSSIQHLLFLLLNWDIISMPHEPMQFWIIKILFYNFFSEKR